MKKGIEAGRIHKALLPAFQDFYANYKAAVLSSQRPGADERLVAEIMGAIADRCQSFSSVGTGQQAGLHCSCLTVHPLEVPVLLCVPPCKWGCGGSKRPLAWELGCCPASAAGSLASFWSFPTPPWVAEVLQGALSLGKADMRQMLHCMEGLLGWHCASTQIVWRTWSNGQAGATSCLPMR